MRSASPPPPAAASFDGITPDGPFPRPLTAANESESFTSDGARRIILTTAGAEITPGNRTSTGGTVRQKPDITAADGVATAAPASIPSTAPRRRHRTPPRLPP